MGRLKVLVFTFIFLRINSFGQTRINFIVLVKIRLHEFVDKHLTVLAFSVQYSCLEDMYP